MSKTASPQPATESALKHTPEPWALDDRGSSYYLDGVEAQFCIENGAGQPIAYAFERGDALKLATAPELLALLQRGLRMTGPTNSESNLQWFADARAAIARATGEQP